MRPRQVAGVAERTARQFLVPRLPVDFDAGYRRRVPPNVGLRLGPFAGNAALLRDCLGPDTRAAARGRAREAAAGSPSFMNRSLAVATGGGVDWYHDRLDDLPRLWRLKLYGFQPLADAVLGFDPDAAAARDPREAFDGWLRDWMGNVAIGGTGYLRRAWTPYAVSLRIQRWARYLAWRDAAGAPDDGFRAAVGRETYKNALFLEAHVERDVGGNHLFENAAALVAAGVLFDADRFLETGLDVLAGAADRQFLADGCHFERSFMYHVLCLARLLTVRDLLGRVGRPVPDRVTAAAQAATGFLANARPPDGRIPLLNDAVYGEALPLDACLAYADGIGVDPTRPATDTGTAGAGDAVPPRTGGAEASGYRWLRTDDGAMLVDGGPVGPPHLPGHAHSDTLTVLLWIDGRKIVTDTGTFDYEAGDRRQYARGVAAHNTVQVGNAEPVALGGRFLMGPRPEPTTRFERGSESGSVSLFEGRYAAAPIGGAGPRYVHHRAASAGDRWWLVRDGVWGDVGAPVAGRLHLAPGIDPTVEPGGAVRLDDADDGRPVAVVRPLGGATPTVTAGEYFPRFGVAVERSVLELAVDERGAGPARLGFLVTPPGVRAEPVDVGPDGLPAAVDAGGVRRLPEPQLTPE